jgi:TPR repeat protein
VVGTVLSCNVFTWVINYIYGRNRWGEFGGEAYGSAGTEEEGYELLNDATKLEAKGCAEEALTLYQRIVERYPHTAASRDAQKSAESLRARLGVACPAPVAAATAPPLSLPQNAEGLPVPTALPVGTQAEGDTGQARPVAVAKPETEAPLICAQTNPQAPDEPPRQIPAPMGPRPKWRMLRLAIGTAAALAIIAGLVAVRMWRDGAQSQKHLPTWDETEEVKGGAQPKKPEALDRLEDERARAEKGDVKAQCSLGVRYHVGKGVPQDYAEAAKWYRKAAERGDAVAQCNLGVCYVNGQGVPKDAAEAVKWYRKAADQGDEMARFSLGECYSEGKGVQQDHAEAAKWFQKAAEQGETLAQPQLVYCYCRLAECYFEGEGVRRDYGEAVKWFRKAAEQGDALAQDRLGLCYSEGQGVAKDYGEAVKWYHKAAEQGFASGQTSLGACYANGEVSELNENVPIPT